MINSFEIALFVIGSVAVAVLVFGNILLTSELLIALGLKSLRRVLKSYTTYTTLTKFLERIQGFPEKSVSERN